MRVYIPDLEKKKILTSDGFELGKIIGFELSPNKWVVEYFSLQLNEKAVDELRLEKPVMGTVIVKLPMNMIGIIHDIIMLKKSLSELREYLRES